MSLSTVLVGEFWADDGDYDEPDGDRPERKHKRQLRAKTILTMNRFVRSSLKKYPPGCSIDATQSNKQWLVTPQVNLFDEIVKRQLSRFTEASAPWSDGVDRGRRCSA
jgi:hypothetical protein